MDEDIASSKKRCSKNESLYQLRDNNIGCIRHFLFYTQHENKVDNFVEVLPIRPLFFHESVKIQKS